MWTGTTGLLLRARRAVTGAHRAAQRGVHHAVGRPALVPPQIRAGVRPVQAHADEVVARMRRVYREHNVKTFDKIRFLASFLRQAAADRAAGGSALESFCRFEIDTVRQDDASNCVGHTLAMRAALPDELAEHAAIAPSRRMDGRGAAGDPEYCHVGLLVGYGSGSGEAQGHVYADLSLAHPEPFVVPAGETVERVDGPTRWRIEDTGQSPHGGPLRVTMTRGERTVFDCAVEVGHIANPHDAITRPSIAAEGRRRTVAKTPDGQPIARINMEVAKSTIALDHVRTGAAAVVEAGADIQRLRVELGEAIEAVIPDFEARFGRARESLIEDVVVCFSERAVHRELMRQGG